MNLSSEIGESYKKFPYEIQTLDAAINEQLKRDRTQGWHTLINSELPRILSPFAFKVMLLVSYQWEKRNGFYRLATRTSLTSCTIFKPAMMMFSYAHILDRERQ